MEMQSEVSYGTNSWDTFLQHSKDPVLNRLYYISRSDPENLFETNEQGYQRVKASEGSFAAIMEGHVAEYFAGRDCSVMAIGEKIELTEQAIGCNNASMCNKLSNSISKLRLKDLQQKWWPNKCNTGPLSDYLNKPEVTLLPPAQPLNTIDLSIAFILLLLGIIVGVIMLLIEVYRANKKSKVRIKSSSFLEFIEWVVYSLFPIIFQIQVLHMMMQ